MQILVLKISKEKEMSNKKLRKVSLDMNDHEDLGMMTKEFEMYPKNYGHWGFINKGIEW